MNRATKISASVWSGTTVSAHRKVVFDPTEILQSFRPGGIELGHATMHVAGADVDAQEVAVQLRAWKPE